MAFNLKSLAGQGRMMSIISGLVIFLFFLLFINPDPTRPEIGRALAIAILMAFWWVTQAIPLAATALIPVVLFPLLGVVNGVKISAMYFNHLIFLFIGGFMMALAMEKWNLHRRIALRILLLFGISPGRILLGFMASTFFLSMWMSNTATAMLMVAIAISILSKLTESVGKEKLGRYPVALMLGIAYSASVGGIATLVGTPPNLSFVRIIAIMFPNIPEISFADWMLFALPLALLLFVLIWLLLSVLHRPAGKWDNFDHSTLRNEYHALGKATREEKIVFSLFILMALLWIFRVDIDIESFVIPGWSRVLGSADMLNDGTVAIFIALLLFIIPSTKKGGALMDWKTATKLPWHIVLLFGGGFALAQGFVDSGLSQWLGESLKGIGAIHTFWIIVCIVLMMTFLTELTSNTATTEMILPVMAGLAVSLQINPLLLMLPATIAASLAFMLPVATPPNAIVFGTNSLTIKDMAFTGVILNLGTALITAAACYYWGAYVFGIDVSVFPDWAVINSSSPPLVK